MEELDQDSDSNIESSLDSIDENELISAFGKLKELQKPFHVTIDFKDLSLWTLAPKENIQTVGTAILQLFMGSGPKHRVDILKGLTGRISPYKMTLLLGPPGAGRTADYIDELDIHAPTLTVLETLKYAWLSSTGGHHSYCIARNEEAAKTLNTEDSSYTKVNDILIGLGLIGCKDTFVGDQTIRGVSGGEKKRTTLGEMLVLPRVVKIMDNISTGLDSATTYDIINALKIVCHEVGSTYLISLLQPAPEVFDMFDEVILLSEGQIIFHGKRELIIPYFESLGYICPSYVDIADFLQELPTPEGRKYIVANNQRDQRESTIPRGTEELAARWKTSDIYQTMLQEMEGNTLPINMYDEFPSLDLESTIQERNYLSNHSHWPTEYQTKYASSYWFHFQLTLFRQIMLTIRDITFIKTRIGQNLVIGAIVGSLFNNIGTTDIYSMNGFLFFTLLFGAISNFAMLPIVFGQKTIFHKHFQAYFYPVSVFTFSQALVLYPLQLIESIIFSTIVYWSAGLSMDENGSRFLTFILILFMFCNCIAQWFRCIAFFMPNQEMAAPGAGVTLVLMALFSGFIQPKSVIVKGWVWFYWLNPLAWGLKAVTLNQYKAPRYNFMVCTNSNCTETQRYGDYILEEYGNPTNERYIWYAFAVLIAEYLFFFFLSNAILNYIHLNPRPQEPIRYTSLSKDSETTDDNQANGHQLESHNSQEFDLPFDVVDFSFQNISYDVSNPKESGKIRLLDSVFGYFEPQKITALMGSSGAGKTTLLDVLSGRKNTGEVTGEMYINGEKKNDRYFRRIMAYVEQFDSLTIKATAREAIEFSAALRLSADITIEQRNQWVDTIVDMMELTPLQHRLIGSIDSGGMSFEQRKRVSIGVEFASNPSILFLDEPTTGLDSRGAQIVIRNIRKIAERGRSIVCTIHQPSTPIFYQFDSLLLLKKGGQVVYFGELGHQSEALIRYFQSIPEVPNIKHRQNPAVWMLEVIGAGTTPQNHNNNNANNTNDTTANNTNTTNNQTIDFTQYFHDSELNIQTNQRLQQLIQSTHRNRSDPDQEHITVPSDLPSNSPSQAQQYVSIAPEVTSHYNQNQLYVASYPQQTYWLLKRAFTTYWRTPSYNFVRLIVYILIALLFGSAYPQQTYHNNISTMSRTAVIFITTMFCGIVGMITVFPVFFAERPVFYREQQSNMYNVGLYSFSFLIVEIPYIIISSGAFVVLFFFIVGFDSTGNTTEKFFWYWLFHSLYLMVLISLGHFYVSLLPTSQVAFVLGGVTNATLILFCGFLRTYEHIPPFWTFMYWLNPLHYALEGLIMSQFHQDHTLITLSNGYTTTAEIFVKGVYNSWKYEDVGYDVIALVVATVLIRMGSYVGLSYLHHDKR